MSCPVERSTYRPAVVSSHSSASCLGAITNGSTIYALMLQHISLFGLYCLLADVRGTLHVCILVLQLICIRHAFVHVSCYGHDDGILATWA